MITATIPKIITAKEFAIMTHDDARRELVNGELIELSPPPGQIHGETQLKTGMVLYGFVEPLGLGRVSTETGYRIAANPDTVRAPDVAFVSARKIAQTRRPRERGYLPFAPDIAVEVASPSDTESEMRRRALMWLEAGSGQAWILYPDTLSARVYRSPSDATDLGPDDILDAAPVLDGFRAKVSDLFQI